MTEPAFDLLLVGAEVCTPSGAQTMNVGVRDGKIAALGVSSQAPARETVDLAGLCMLPGCIDTQVHFREPGLEHKEDLHTGTAAAVAGGITTIFEMPNTNPNTDTEERLRDKLARASGRAFAHHAFFIGATAENAAELARLELLSGAAGVKVFMGSSTGSLLVSDQPTLERVLSSGRRRVAVHCEDEPRLLERKQRFAEGSHDVSEHPEWRDEQTALLATTRLLQAARKTSRPVHALHITTRQEIELLAANKDIATVEVTPQHLTLSAPSCYERLGSRAQMNPPIRTEEHRAALWEGIRQGVVDVLGSDHAPHTLEEKARPYPGSPSGMPGVQTMLPLMLDHVHAGRLSLFCLIDLLCSGPSRIYNLASKGRIAVGYDADLTIVDRKLQRVIEDAEMRSKCGWTPFVGMTVTGWPRLTIVGGTIAMREDELTTEPQGKPVRFWDVPERENHAAQSAPARS